MRDQRILEYFGIILLTTYLQVGNVVLKAGVPEQLLHLPLQGIVCTATLIRLILELSIRNEFSWILDNPATQLPVLDICSS